MNEYTTRRAAELLGLSIWRIRKACQSMGVEKNQWGCYAITDDVLERIRVRKGKVGNPGKGERNG